jgi:hypothetical protein
VSLACVQWSNNPDQLNRGPITGPLPLEVAQHMAASLLRQSPPVRAVRVVPVDAQPRQLTLPLSGARHV